MTVSVRCHSKRGQEKGQGTAEELVSANLIGEGIMEHKGKAPLVVTGDGKLSELAELDSLRIENSVRALYGTETLGDDSVPDAELHYKDDKFRGTCP
jgi:hypothetical protein